MKKITLLILLVILANIELKSQSLWSLDSCISYAVQNNFTVKKNMLDLESRHIELKSAKMEIAPSVSASIGENFDIGRAASASGVILNNSQSSTSLGAYVNMPLFQGLRTHYNIQLAKYNLQASIYDLEQVKDDIELTVTAYYLQVLLLKEALEIAHIQEEISGRQVERIEKMVDFGKSSDADLFEAEASHAADQFSITDANNNLRLALLDLAQLINLELNPDFDIQKLEDRFFDNLIQKEFNITNYVSNGLMNKPGLKATEQRIAASERQIKMVRSGWYPTLNFSMSYGTGYYYAYNSAYLESNLPFDTQLENNSRGMFSLSLNIPIFDKLSTYNSVKSAKINLANYQIQLEEEKANLTKEIEQAYANVIASKEKYISAKTYLAAAEKSFNYEEIRFEAGGSTIFQFNEARARFEKAQSDLIQAKYSFLIRVKILEFYN